MDENKEPVILGKKDSFNKYQPISPKIEVKTEEKKEKEKIERKFIVEPIEQKIGQITRYNKDSDGRDCVRVEFERISDYYIDITFGKPQNNLSLSSIGKNIKMPYSLDHRYNIGVPEKVEFIE